MEEDKGDLQTYNEKLVETVIGNRNSYKRDRRIIDDRKRKISVNQIEIKVIQTEIKSCSYQLQMIIILKSLRGRSYKCP